SYSVVSAELARASAQFQKAPDLELSDPFTRQVRDVADLFERVTAGGRDVERARMAHLPRLEIRKVQLDRSGARVDVEIEVVLARYPRARAHLFGALRARSRAIVGRRQRQLSGDPLRSGQPARRDRARTGPRAARPHLATRDRRQLGRDVV